MSYRNSSKCLRRKLYRKDKELKQYINETKQKKVHIVTTRFTNKTWDENRAYCEKHKTQLQCAYGVPLQTNNDLTTDDVLFATDLTRGSPTPRGSCSAVTRGLQSLVQVWQRLRGESPGGPASHALPPY